MRPLRLFSHLLRWDVLRELRRRESILNMTLFAVLVLFVVDLGMSPLLAVLRSSPDASLRELAPAFGPVLYWVAVLFAGTVGLSQSFAAEREGSALTGVILAPLDLGLFYLAKVAAAWLYILVMELCLLAAYAVLFGPGERMELPPLLAILALFSLVYVAAGVFLAAMTSALRGGGEVVLRILLLPLLLPVLYLTFSVREGTFGESIAPGPAMSFGRYAASAAAIAAIYLSVGFFVFPRIFEE